MNSSTETVYPATDGYKDAVIFSIRGLTSIATRVKITGTARLEKGTRVVKTWRISNATTAVRWNGRVGSRIEAGIYTLVVTARSADGSTRTARMPIRVSAEHLARRVVTVTSIVRGSDTTAAPPARVVGALRLGEVTVRVRTVAHVRGVAKLVFSNAGVKRSIVLRNGTHTTTPLPVPKGFAMVSITHRWKKQTATLDSVEAIWSYRTLI